MSRFKDISKRAMALFLSIALVITMIPVGALPAFANTTGNQKIADGSTMDTWQRRFGSTDGSISTEFAGGIWTDKSVFAETLKIGTKELKVSNPNNFLVSLSAIASTESITGMDNTPVDVMLILDLSSSMYKTKNSAGNDIPEPNTVPQMIQSVNETIDKLYALNDNNRVGVSIYYGGSDVNTQSAASYSKLLLSLDRYTKGSKGYLTHTVAGDGYIGSVGVAAGVKDSKGNVENTSYSTPSSRIAGTYAQRGIILAMQQFLAATTTTPEGDERLPIFVFMSDGEPTAATEKFASTNANATMGNNQVSTRNGNETDFVTQLTASYAKEQVDLHYEKTPEFYTLSLGTSISLDVMDPASQTNSTINSYWNSLVNNGTVSFNTKNYSNWSLKTVGHTVTKATLSDNTKFPTNVNQRLYVDDTFTATDYSELSEAFESIFDKITLKTKYYPTLVDGDEASMSGNVSFMDRVGEYMTVTDVKGIAIGDHTYSGLELAKNFVSNGQDLGTFANPNALGIAFRKSVMNQLGIDVDNTASALIQSAYDTEQLVWKSDTDYSNYIGWFATEDNSYLGHWTETATRPSTAKYAIKSYFYRDSVGAAEGTDSTDMMYAYVWVRTDLDTGEEDVIFSIPAALIPTVTYTVELDQDGNPTSLTANEVTSPVRLVYEVGLREDINEFNIFDKVSKEYIDANSVKDDEDNVLYVNFYSNQWQENTGYNSVNTYSYFRPSRENGRYYYDKDTLIYVSDGKGGYKEYTDEQRPTVGNEYYRQYEYYTKDANGNLEKHIGYRKISDTTVSSVGDSGTDVIFKDTGYWYVRKGTVHVNIEGYGLTKVGGNATNTYELANAPYIDTSNTDHMSDPNHNFVVGGTLGNNGKLVIKPETGIKIQKLIDDAFKARNVDDWTTKAFDMTIERLAGSTNTLTKVVVDADGNESEPTTVTLSGGKATFQIKANETVYLYGMSAGDQFKVSEAESVDYKLVSINNDPDLKAYTFNPVHNEMDSAVFLNTAKGKGEIALNKLVDTSNLSDEVNFVETKEFDVEVTLSGVGTANATFPVVHNGDETIMKTDDDGKVSFQIKSKDSINIKDLPEGTTAVIKETLTGDDAKHYTVTYQVDTNSATNDKADVTVSSGYTSVVKLTNKWVPDVLTAKLNLNVNKILKDASDNAASKWPEGTSFVFDLQQYDSETEKWSSIGKATATSAGKFEIEDLEGKDLTVEFTKAGTYGFQLYEILGNVPNVEYDQTYHVFTVTVGNDADGNLYIKSAQCTHGGHTSSDHFDVNKNTVTGTFEFNNRYDDELDIPAKVTFDIFKKLLNESGSPIGQDLTGYDFEFYTDSEFTTTLADAIANNYVNGVTIDADNATDVSGTAWIRLEFDKEDEYTFYLKEVNDGKKNVTYSDVKLKAVVNVTKVTNNGVNGHEIDVTVTDLAGNLVTPVTSQVATDNSIIVNIGELGEEIFVNSYVPTSTTFELTPKKVLEDKSGNQLVLTAGKFEFEVKDLAGKLIGTYTNDTDGNVGTLNESTGKVSPISIPLNEARQYTFVISEVSGTAAGEKIAYDKNDYQLVLLVEDINGELKVTKSSIVDNPTTSTDITFTNVKYPDEIEDVIRGMKTLKNMNLRDAMFTFILSEADSEGNVKAEGKQYTVNNADGTYAFPKFVYKEAGTHYYVLEEDTSNPIVTQQFDLDDTKYLIKVVVTANRETGELSLVRTAQKMDASITEAEYSANVTYDFTNEYHKGDIKLQLTGTKALTGDTLKEGQFSFNLMESDANWAEGNVIETVSNKTDGSLNFKELTYTEPGTYYYLVKEATANKDAGYVYDNTVFRIKAEVSYNMDTGQFGLTKTITSVEGTNAEQTRDNIVFINHKIEPCEVTIYGQKFLEGRELKEGEFKFNLYATDDTFTVSDNATPIESVTNNIVELEGTKFGGFSFSTFEFDSPGDVGTHYYVVKEDVSNEKGGVTYDESIYKVAITVTNDANEVYTATTSITKDDEEATSIVFHNEYKPATTTAVVDAVKKVLSGKLLEPGMFQFQLTLKSVDGVAVTGDDASPITTSNGMKYNAETKAYEEYAQDPAYLDFNLLFEKAGTYKYEMTEVAGSANKVTYDSSIFDVTIVVTDDGEGTLTAATPVVTKRDAAAGAPLNFVNGYVPDEVTVDLNGTKNLTGKTLEDGAYTFVLENKSGTPTKKVEVTNGGSADNDENQFAFSLTFTKDDLGEVNGEPVMEKTFEYKVYEKVPADAENNVKDGVAYDTTVYDVSITVKDDGNGQLAAATVITKDGENSNIAFNNDYNAEPTSVQFKATKTLETSTQTADRVLKADEFKFVLKDADGKVLQTQKNKADGSVAFDTIEYVDEGTYTYTISEVKESLGGIVYDETVYTVTVEVKDNGKGKLVATAKVGEAAYTDEAIRFNNEYTINDKETVDLSGTKKMTGEPFKNGDLSGFEFGLYEGDKLIEKATSKADGTYKFTTLEYTAPGEHNYTVKEIDTDVPGVSYDNTVYTVKVTVEHDGKGQLNEPTVSIVTGGNVVAKFISRIFTDIQGDKLDFTNDYTVTEVEYSLQKSFKNLTGRDVAAEEFTFAQEGIKDTNSEGQSAVGRNAAAKAGEDVKINFSDITYTKAGTYVYTVSEVKGNLGGVTYDQAKYQVTIEVVDNNSKLEVKSETYKALDGEGNATGDNLDKVTFVNDYKPQPTSLTPKATKIFRNLSNDNVEFKAGQFEFELYQTDADFDIKGTNAELLQTKVNGEPGTATSDGIPALVQFDTITYDKVGTFYYVIKEVVPEDNDANPGNGVINGITYSNRSYHVTVTVVDNLNGTLTAAPITATSDGLAAESIRFVNAYDNVEAQFNIRATKKLVGTGSALAAGTYEFGLYAADGTTPIVDTETNKPMVATNDAGGVVQFKTLKFTESGVYTYKVKELIPAEKVDGVTYDESVYTVEITVAPTTADAGILGTSVKITKDDNPNALDSIVFTNYDPKDVSVVLNGVKVLEGRDLKADEFVFNLVSEDGKVLEEVKNGADGAFKFATLTFDQVGTYKYTITEVQNKVPGVIYDKNQDFEVVIDVKANEQNTELVASITIDGKAANEAQVKFTNKYIPTTPKTGDDTNAGLWTSILALAATGFVGLGIMRKKEEEEA